jgi:plasmid stabilization system protein ParE
MPNYELADTAEEDLKDIAQYTISQWGAKQTAHYGALLDAHFEAIGNGKARTRIFRPHRPELRVSRIEHHYVFHLERHKTGREKNFLPRNTLNTRKKIYRFCITSPFLAGFSRGSRISRL